MTEFAFSERFFGDMQAVEFESKQDEVMDAISLLPVVPEMGGRRIPASIEREFGANVRKLVVSPFFVVYEIMEDEDLLFVHGLVHQRRAK